VTASSCSVPAFRGIGDAALLLRDDPEQVCIKVGRIDGWLREAYFGLLPDGHPRAVRAPRSLPADARRRPGALLPGPGARATAIPARTCSRPTQVDGGRGAARIAGIPEVLGSCTAASCRIAT
jgi:hypothetical protein